MIPIDQYVTGKMIRKLREQRGMTQLQLAEKLGVSDKSVSKWETSRGYPDITLLESLAEALGVSIIELLSGKDIINTNRSFNMLKMKFYVCPVCGNVICSTGEAVISCCGITLPPLEADVADDDHPFIIEKVEDEYFISINHEMSKQHYISFIAAIKHDGCEIVKLYPEGNAQARFKINRTHWLYFYCNRHGLFKVLIR